MAYQRRLPTLLLTFILSFSPSSTSGKTYYSHLGKKCTGNCELLNSGYQCKVLMTNGKCTQQYCSPKINVDYRGYECLGCCAKQGFDYYWCKTSSSWGYCGDVIEDSLHYTSYYNVECYDSCEKRGYQYNWCHTQKGWDYCSPRSNVDYKDNFCNKDHPCDKHGNKYYWCDLDKGGWDYCARVEPKAIIYQTSYKLKDCIDECQYYEYGDYFWCHTSGGWDYCSPLPDVTYKGVPCRSDHKCGTHGYSYNWCYTTDKNNYDYCGVISPGECLYSLPQSSNQQLNKKEVICRREDINNRRVTTFTAVEAPNDFTEPNRRTRNEALGLINQWDNQGLGDQARSELITSDNLRIDLQGLFDRDNQRYYNLQIQENRPRRNREPTTLAQILVPVGTTAEYMRLAFSESLQRRARVLLEVSVTPAVPGRGICRRH